MTKTVTLGYSNNDKNPSEENPTVQVTQDLQERFGSEASATVAPRLGNVPIGDPHPQTAASNRVHGALVGAAIGEALGAPVEGRTRQWIANNCGTIAGHLVPSPRAGSDTQLALMTADSILAEAAVHPGRSHRRRPERP